MSTRDKKILIIFVVLILIFFSPALLEGRLPGPFEYLNIWRPWYSPDVKGNANYILSDQVDYVYPNYSFLKTALRAGQIPFWNDGIDFGTPFFNLLTIGHFYPPVALALLFPLEYVWFISAALRMLLTGFFVYKLLDFYKIDISIAVLGGIVSMFSLYSIVWIGTSALYPYSAAPLFFYAISRILQESTPKTRLLLLLSSINLLLSSFPSIIFYIIFTGIFYGIFLLRSRVFKQQGWQALVIGVLAAGICIIPLYYTAQFLSNVDLEYRSTRGLIHLPMRQIIQMAFPLAFGDYTEMARQKLRNFNEATNYSSIVLLFFSGVSYIYLMLKHEYRRLNHVWFWSIIQIWSVMMVYGLFGILNIFSKLPVFDNNPSTRLNIMVVFASIIVGAFAMHKTIFEPSSRLYIERVSLTFGSIGAIFSLQVLTGLYLSRSGMEISATHLGTQLLVLVTALILTLDGMFSSSLISKRLSISIISLITFLNLFFLGNNYNSTYTLETFYPRTEIINYLTSELDKGAKIITVGRNLIPHMGLTYGIGSIQSHWWSNTEQIEILRQLDPDYKAQARTQDFFDTLDLYQSNDLLDFLNIEYIVINDKDLALIQVNSDEFHVLEFPNNLFLIENINRPYSSMMPSSNCNDSTLYDFVYENNSIQFATNFCNVRTITLPIWNYPGWKLNQEIDSGIQLSNHDGLIAVQIPSGLQKIVIKYVPSHFYILLAITISFIFLAFVVVQLRKLDLKTLPM